LHWQYGYVGCLQKDLGSVRFRLFFSFFFLFFSVFALPFLVQ
jgi:hypothetical protein